MPRAGHILLAELLSAAAVSILIIMECGTARRRRANLLLAICWPKSSRALELRMLKFTSRIVQVHLLCEAPFKTHYVRWSWASGHIPIVECTLGETMPLYELMRLRGRGAGIHSSSGGRGGRHIRGNWTQNIICLLLSHQKLLLLL